MGNPEIVVHGDAKTVACVHLGRLWGYVRPANEGEKVAALSIVGEILAAIGVSEAEIEQTIAILKETSP